ncbi:hypothetical protein [Halomarina oriensis]|uniref:Uncharacterized protein n=1 Tax=Halomarina oriensis TaxID=671145 RepID=A0A6B0GHL0_9EURY|nr:hypothetical protein [Halomarina oriensis]MWG34090.1 hypothetical protein [Halomarina oriensis]
MELTELLQALTLWFVVIIALDTVELSGGVMGAVGLVGLALLYLLPLYIIGGTIAMVGESARETARD